MTDRYLKIILTVIALELLWIGLKDTGIIVRAQAPAPPAAQLSAQTTPQAPIPVIIKAVEIEAPARGAMPVYSAIPLNVTVTSPVTVDTTRPIAVVSAAPLKVEADQPLPVTNVPYTPSRVPGE